MLHALVNFGMLYSCFTIAIPIPILEFSEIPPHDPHDPHDQHRGAAPAQPALPDFAVPQHLPRPWWGVPGSGTEF